MSVRTNEEILTEIQQVLEELFDLPADKVTPSAKLNADLGLDSIDAVDMVVKLQELTGKKLSPEEFKSITTVEDIVNTVSGILQNQNE